MPSNLESVISDKLKCLLGVVMLLSGLMCVGSEDVDRLFLRSLISCVRHVKWIGRIVIVTPDRLEVERKIREAGVPSIDIIVLSDYQVLTPDLVRLAGWSRQQAIKLSADRLFEGGPVLYLGADTIILRPLPKEVMFQDGEPVLYYNRREKDSRHLEYERRRVGYVAELLRVRPLNSLPLGDFIMDVNILDSRIVAQLKDVLASMHGPNPLAKIIPANPVTYEDKVRFGEWTLYAVFLLDYLNLPCAIRNSDGTHLVQVHSEKDLQEYKFDSRIAHFVSKNFDIDYLCEKLDGAGVVARFD